MSIIDDIRAEKEAAVEALDDLIMKAHAQKNGATSESERQRWADIQQQLEEKRERLDVLAFQRTLQEAQPALDALRDLTEHLQTTAGHMQSAINFAGALNGLLGAADKAIGALNNV